jgi:cholesterol oxidase
VAIPFGSARRSVVLVVMQDLESSLRIRPRPRRLGRRGWTLASEATGESQAPTYIPIANDFAQRMARKMNGIALSATSEVLLGIPATAHILGGNVLADSPDAGVVDRQQRAFGYPNLLICDGSVIPSNLGVNPALSILAFTERALSFIPPKGGGPETVRWLAADQHWGVRDLLLSQGNTG